MDDPEWDPERGVGGWSFLDAVGFRYYLPAAMTRCLVSGRDEGIAYHLKIETPEESFDSHIDWRDFHLGKWSALDERQRRCLKRFLKYMVVLGEYKLLGCADETPPIVEIARHDLVGEWQEALDRYWEDA